MWKKICPFEVTETKHKPTVINKGTLKVGAARIESTPKDTDHLHGSHVVGQDVRIDSPPAVVDRRTPSLQTQVEDGDTEREEEEDIGDSEGSKDEKGRSVAKAAGCGKTGGGAHVGNGVNNGQVALQTEEATAEEARSHQANNLHAHHVVGKVVGVACRYLGSGPLSPPSLETNVQDECRREEEEEDAGDEKATNIRSPVGQLWKPEESGDSRGS
ncbi:hypothetical protein GBF38_000329 [Nibea albiflora]|nr:hypothetical protein GBF38_000329 [Nibea albiflora]